MKNLCLFILGFILVMWIVSSITTGYIAYNDPEMEFILLNHIARSFYALGAVFLMILAFFGFIMIPSIIIALLIIFLFYFIKSKGHPIQELNRWEEEQSTRDKIKKLKDEWLKDHKEELNNYIKDNLNVS